MGSLSGNNTQGVSKRRVLLGKRERSIGAEHWIPGYRAKATRPGWDQNAKRVGAKPPAPAIKLPTNSAEKKEEKQKHELFGEALVNSSLQPTSLTPCTYAHPMAKRQAQANLWMVEAFSTFVLITHLDKIRSSLTFCPLECSISIRSDWCAWSRLKAGSLRCLTQRLFFSQVAGCSSNGIPANGPSPPTLPYHDHPGLQAMFLSMPMRFPGSPPPSQPFMILIWAPAATRVC